jgi:hypothetical protein
LAAVAALAPELDADAARLDRLPVRGGAVRGLTAPRDLDPADPETKLVALARVQAPLRRTVARLASRLEALRAWERIGWSRRRDYANERLGVSGRLLQELAHMDRALGGLPVVEGAFASGRISWTKARLISRVARAEDAERWLAHAERVTARDLSREVRAVDQRAHDLLQPETDEDGESEGGEKETVFVRCTPAVRAKWHRARFLASRFEGHPVPPWMVAEGIAAEALSAIPLDAEALERIEAEQASDASGSECEADGCLGRKVAEAPTLTTRDGAESAASSAARAAQEPANGCAGHAHARVDAGRSAASVLPEPANGCARQGPGSETGSSAPGAATAATSGAPSASGCAAQGMPSQDPVLAPLLEGLDEADPFELDSRLGRALDAERRLEAEMGPLLLAVARGRLYRAYGCSRLGEFAREWLGISPRKAEALVRVERAGRIGPRLSAGPTAREVSRGPRHSFSPACSSAKRPSPGKRPGWRTRSESRCEGSRTRSPGPWPSATSSRRPSTRPGVAGRTAAPRGRLGKARRTERRSARRASGRRRTRPQGRRRRRRPRGRRRRRRSSGRPPATIRKRVRAPASSA